jgi:hypothetical protein
METLVVDTFMSRGWEGNLYILLAASGLRISEAGPRMEALQERGQDGRRGTAGLPLRQDRERDQDEGGEAGSRSASRHRRTVSVSPQERTGLPYPERHALPRGQHHEAEAAFAHTPCIPCVQEIQEHMAATPKLPARSVALLDGTLRQELHDGTLFKDGAGHEGTAGGGGTCGIRLPSRRGGHHS